MTYALQQDLVDRFGERELIQLTDRAEEPTGAIDAAIIAAVLAGADATIDSYISKRYALPLSATPARLVAVACDLARYDLYKDDAPERVKDAYHDALRFLRDVSNGVAQLAVAGAEPAREGAAVLTSGPDRVFDATSMKGF